MKYIFCFFIIFTSFFLLYSYTYSKDENGFLRIESANCLKNKNIRFQVNQSLSGADYTSLYENELFGTTDFLLSFGLYNFLEVSVEAPFYYERVQIISDSIDSTFNSHKRTEQIYENGDSKVKFKISHSINLVDLGAFISTSIPTYSKNGYIPRPFRKYPFSTNAMDTEIGMLITINQEDSPSLLIKSCVLIPGGIKGTSIDSLTEDIDDSKKAPIFISGVSFRSPINKYLTFFTELSAETSTRNKGEFWLWQFADDPLRITPGIKIYPNKHINLDFAFDIGLSPKTPKWNLSLGIGTKFSLVKEKPSIPIVKPLQQSKPVAGSDKDKDGIPDYLDICPDNPEDIDNYQDNDGCPDVDNDRDGIPDSIDDCPDVPEIYNGYEDNDGCPDIPPKTF